MRPRHLLVGLLAAVIAFIGATGPASAGRVQLQQIGRGTWSETTGAVSFTGATTGEPIEGDTTGTLAAKNGTLPAPGWLGGCTPATGTITTTSGNDTLTVSITGDVCSSPNPAVRLVLVGWYDVVEYSAAKGKKAYDGRGGLDIRVLSDGTIQWMLSGGLR